MNGLSMMQIHFIFTLVVAAVMVSSAILEDVIEDLVDRKINGGLQDSLGLALSSQIGIVYQLCRPLFGRY